MFGDEEPFEREVRALLELYSVEDLLDLLDVSPELVIRLLFVQGLAEVPDFVVVGNGDVEALLLEEDNE